MLEEIIVDNISLILPDIPKKATKYKLKSSYETPFI